MITYLHSCKMFKLPIVNYDYKRGNKVAISIYEYANNNL